MDTISPSKLKRGRQCSARELDHNFDLRIGRHGEDELGKMGWRCCREMRLKESFGGRGVEFGP